MMVSDFESRLLSKHVEEDEMELYIRDQESLKVASVHEAEQRVKAYIKMLK